MIEYLALLGFIGLVSPELRWFKLFFLFSLIPLIKHRQEIYHFIGNIVAKTKHPPAVKTVFSLPFNGTWYVLNGGPDKETSHSWNIMNQRYAYDFVILKRQKSHRGSGKKLKDYYAYGKPVLAPADGTVVEVRNCERDSRPGDFRGNYVIIDHGDCYSFIAHLSKVTVKKGEKVRRGQKIGVCGNTGFSTEPHIHFHVQDTKNFYTSVSILPKFRNIIINGKKKKFGTIKKGDYVSNQ